MKTLEEIKKIPGLLIVKTAHDGGMGWLCRGKKPWASVVWSWGGGWDHVSISPCKKSYTPSWDEMCELKDDFFYEDEAVVQYHPAKSEYVNNVRNCLHIWKPQNEALPIPPSYMVGLKKGQTWNDVIREASAEK